MIKTFEILDIDDDRWDGLVKDTDIFYQRDYLRVFAQSGNDDFTMSFSGIPVLIHYYDENGDIVYPVFIRKWKDVFDISSPYGYSGPKITGNPLLEAYAKEMANFCCSHSIVVEFIRLHPWISEGYENIEKKQYAGKVWFIDLSKSLNNIFSMIPKKCRNAIQKANKNIVITIATNVNALIMVKDAYVATMTRNEAEQKYFFSKGFFEDLQYSGAVCFIASEKGKHVASAVFLSYGEFCHYFLAGSLNGRGSNAGNLIIWKAVQFFKEEGCKIMNLGGGMTGNPGLENFKKSFTCNSKDFFIVKKIHDEQEYMRQCNAAKTNDKGFFPAYRK